MNRKKLSDLAWNINEDEYRSSPFLSYSILSSFFKNGPKSLINKEKIDTPSLRFGSLVDCILTAPEEFDDRFYVADIDRFSDTFRAMTETIYNNHPDLESISETPNLLEYIGDWQPRWGEKAKIDAVVKGCSDYYTVLKYSTGKIVIPPQEFSEARQCVMTLKTHPFSYQIFECNEDEEIFYQLKFKHTTGQINIRIMTDIIKVNHKDKWIQVYDLKTSGKNEEQFEESFNSWNYWIQSGMYLRVVEKNIHKDEYFKDFNVLPFKFIVINKNNLTPLIWEANSDYIYEEIFKKYNTSWKRLLLDANWHLQNGKFDYSRKSYENNGCNPIILKL